MKVSIITEGYDKTGYGHITRCLALYQAFELRNIIPAFYVNGDEGSLSFLADTNHEIINWLENQDTLFRKIINSDVVIVDSYLAPKEFYNRISLVTPTPVFIDDFVRLEFPNGIIINGLINAETLGYFPKSERTLLLGTKYASLRKEFWEVGERPFRLDIQNILLTFGGQDIENLTPRVLRMLSRNFPNMRKRVIVGGGFINEDQIEQAKDVNTEIYKAPLPQELVKLMHDSDLALTTGGQTIVELARVGVPTIAICVAKNQILNMNGWVKEKFLQAELTHNQPNLENRLLLLINSFRKKQPRELAAKIGRQKVDGSGAKRVVQHLIEKYAGKSGFYFRKTINRDSALLFNLINDKLVRATSIYEMPLKWGDYLDWFSGKLMDDDCYFLLAFTTSDQFIGQIRFDIKGYYAEINTSIHQDWRGKGNTKLVVFNASYKCFYEKPNVGYIHAFVKPQDSQSLALFTQAGYVLAERTTINNQEVIVCKLQRPR
ncbi:MAG: acetyltransferase GNAT family [Ignavibacteria bacterium]|nr:MAG: acetyltransferase GNAT family [Ignavibacteria bacterium]KAF0156535.1 MAG: acetyltransferase GNAT family [Ignavibacteria bacterium]